MRTEISCRTKGSTAPKRTPYKMSSAPLHELVAVAVASDEDDMVYEHHNGAGSRIDGGAAVENRANGSGLSPSRASTLPPSSALNMQPASANALDPSKASMFLPGMGSFPTVTVQEESPRNAILTRACDNCRSSHTKCDGAERCLNCSRKNLACIYSKAKRRGRKPARQEDALSVADSMDLATDLLNHPIISNETHRYSISAAGAKRQRLSVSPNVGTATGAGPADEFKHDEHLLASYVGAYKTSIDFLFGSFAPLPASILGFGSLRTLNDVSRAAANLSLGGSVKDQSALVTFCSAAAIGAMIIGAPRYIVDDIIKTADDFVRGPRGLMFDFANKTAAGALFLLGYALFTHAQVYSSTDCSDASQTDEYDFDDEGDFALANSHSDNHNISAFKANTYFTLAGEICENANIYNTSTTGLTVQILRLLTNGAIAPQRRADGFAHVARAAFGVCPGRTVMASVFRIQECLKHDLPFDAAEAKAQLQQLLSTLPEDHQNENIKTFLHFQKLIIQATLGWLRIKGKDTSAADETERDPVATACEHVKALAGLSSNRAFPPCWTTQFVRLKSLVNKAAASDSIEKGDKPVADLVETLPWKGRVAHALRKQSTIPPISEAPPQTAAVIPSAPSPVPVQPQAYTMRSVSPHPPQQHMLPGMPSLTPQQMMFLPHIMGLPTSSNPGQFPQQMRPGMLPVPSGLPGMWSPHQAMLPPGMFPNYGNMPYQM
eukprot:TRINITY_DN4276_c0_g1_i1.p1 TRINITY_DN4276_c0_g1~~TRINITY_DN4276_c0_g1_i1.p1  ORF type:complete len:721 (+),score=115.81 TRINITY_DN4276_c0_g1_i1:48-2210(+)